MREERSVIPTHTNIQLILSMLKRNEEWGHIPELRITDLGRQLEKHWKNVSLFCYNFDFLFLFLVTL